MDLSYTPEEEAFRAEVRAFLDAEVPAQVRTKVRLGRRLHKDDMVGWQKILHRRGWGAGLWPTRFGGAGWSVVQQYIFEEESTAANAPPQLPFSLRMVAPVLMTLGTSRNSSTSFPDHRRGGLVVSGLLRTGFRLGSCLPAHQRNPCGRALPG